VGKLETYKIPVGKNIRLDDGYEEGMEIPIYYDPMISKLITYGKNRTEAIQLMIRAIENYRVDGVKTTLPFGKFVCEHEAFKTGKFNTHFVKNYYSADKLKAEMDKEAEIAAKLALKLYLEEQKLLKIPY
jgi:propionyl-CoA carboxylase alpha chain